MRKRELQRLIAKWQARLRLENWKVALLIRFVEKFPDQDAQLALPSLYLREAELELDPRAPDPERSLLHELVHLRLVGLVPWETAEELEEPVVWAFTDALLAVERQTPTPTAGAAGR